MELKSMLKDLVYLGEVESKRQTYYLFKSPRRIFLFTLRENGDSGNFSIIDPKAVDYVFNKMKGKKGQSANDIRKASKKPDLTEAGFAVLNIMYVLIAQKRASIDKRYKGKSLIFNFSSE
jgi:hypothetical protein